MPKYAHSIDQEHYVGEHDSRDEALAEGRDDSGNRRYWPVRIATAAETRAGVDVMGCPAHYIHDLAWSATRDMIADHARISTAIDTAAHAARTHVRRSIGQQFRRAREQLGITQPAPPPHHQESP